MNKGQIKDETLELLGDNILQLGVTPESLEDSMVFAQEELARKLGLTYVESDAISLGSNGIMTLPPTLIHLVRLWWIPDTAPLPLTITVPEYADAGQFLLSASIPAQAGGSTISWTGTNVSFRGALNGPVLSYDAGLSEQYASVTAPVTALDGSSGSVTGNTKVVPYTSSIQFTTPTISAGGLAIMEVDLGWSYGLVSASVSATPCWIRIYNKRSDLDADYGRDITADPPVGSPLVWEGIFTSGTTIIEAPDVWGVNGDGPRTKKAYLTIGNKDIISRSYVINIIRTELKPNGTF